MKFEYCGYANKGGIYKITNIKTNAFYIGSTFEFKTRGRDHLRSLEYNKHKNKYLQASWTKHGPEAFIFEVLEVVEGDKLARTTKEQEYLDKVLQESNWDICFNFKKIALQKEGPWSNNPEETKKN